MLVYSSDFYRKPDLVELKTESKIPTCIYACLYFMQSSFSEEELII
jgi:hypothetical protein